MNTPCSREKRPLNKELTPIDFLRGLTQNRITAIGIFQVGVTLCGHDLSELGLALGPLLATFFGTTTAIMYKRTCHHIERFGSIDDRFFLKVVKIYGKDRFFGYCELQGMYLAAKKYGKEKEFGELRKKYSNNIIPNF